jgi:Cd2+/Zn2+-exporting ATPase
MVLPPLIQGAGNKDIWSRWIYTSLSFLVVSCPCAVVISVPLSYVSGIGLASKYGILVKGATYFDRLASLKTVGFDKTGTLTTGKMSLALVKPCGIDEDTFMDYLSAAESESSHPIAIAVEKARQGNPSLVSDYEEVEGKGVKCTYKGHKLKVGKKSFLEEEGIEESDGDGTALYLSVDGKYSGYALLSDTMREEVPALISSLRKEGVRTVLISGDRKQNVEALASALSIDAAYSSLLPKEKTEVIEKEKKRGEMVYLGDGVNDAASLSLADVGIAMGGLGSDLAVENADVVILDDNPGKLEKLIRIARKTKNMAISNVVVAILVKVTIMILNLVIPSLPLWISVLGDTGLTFLLVLRSMALFMLGKPKKNKK